MVADVNVVYVIINKKLNTSATYHTIRTVVTGGFDSRGRCSHWCYGAMRKEPL